MTSNHPVILIADADSAIRMSLYKMLSTGSFEVILAEDGNQALKWIEKRVFDIVLLDIKLPIVSGLDVLRILHQQHPEIVVIVLTAYGTLDTVITALRHNVYDFLLKPCEALDLRKSILGALEERRIRLLNQNAHKLISLAAHELRNAVTRVNLAADMVYMSSEVERPPYFDALKTQTRHLSQIATNMLDLVNIEEQGKHLFRSLNLNDLLDELLLRFVARAKAKGLHLIWQPKFGLPPIVGNLSQLELAFTTVIINAIDYTLTGHLSIHTRFNKRTNMVGCVVQDTGVGIDPADMPHLFKRFYRGKTIPQTLSGMGLGLAIVKEIVDIHDGKIDVESQVGEGSVFTLWLPVSNIPATQLRQDTNYQCPVDPLSS